jgi:WD40 repeat protein
MIRPGIQDPNKLFDKRLDAGLWKEFVNVEHRFRVQFPGIPNQWNKGIGATQMAWFEWQLNNEWDFCVGHATFKAEEVRAQAPEARFGEVRQHFNGENNQFNPIEFGQITLAGIPSTGRAWEYNLFQFNQRLVVHVYHVPEGQTVHQFVLAARGPVGPVAAIDISRFLNSFRPTLSISGGSSIHEEIDTPAFGNRRDNEFTALALHPTRPVAVTGSTIGMVHCIESKQQRGFTPRGQKAIRQLVASSDGAWIAIASGEEVQLWNWSQEKDLAIPFVFKHMVPGLRAAFTKNQHLLTATKDEVTEYILGNNALPKVSTKLLVPALTVTGFAVSPDGSLVAIHGDKAIEFWAWPEKKLQGRIDAHDADITAMTFSPDGKTLASASADRTIKLWQVDTLKERATLKQHAWTVWALAFAPDGKHLVSGGLDGMLLVWDVVPDQPKLVWAESRQFPVRAVAFDQDGKHLYFTCKHPAAGNQVGAKQYARQLRKLAWADIKPNPKAAEAAVAQHAGLRLPTTCVMSYFTPDGKRFVTTTDPVDTNIQENSLRIWDTATATVRASHSMLGNGWLSPDGKWMVFSGPNMPKEVRLLDVQTNRVFTNLLSLPTQVSFAMFTPDSKSLWLQQDHEFVRFELNVLKNGEPKLVEKNRIVPKAQFDPRNVTILPALDSKSFLIEVRSGDGILRAHTQYASADGAELPRPKTIPGDWSSHLCMRRVALGQVELNDLLTGVSLAVGQQRQPMIYFDVRANMNVNGDRGVVNAYTINLQRKYAVTTCLDPPTVRVNLWDLQGRQPVLTLSETQTRAIKSVRFSPDGRYLSLVTADSWTRIVPTDWLVERKGLLPCPPNDVTGP